MAVRTIWSLCRDGVRKAIASVIETAISLTLWALVCVGRGCLLIGPIGLKAISPSGKLQKII